MKTIKNIFTLIAGAIASIGIFIFAACDKSEHSDSLTGRNFAVYGKIFTADEACSIAEAFVVKDGRFIYVGSKAGAAKYITEDMKTIHHTEGIVIPGCYEGHAHYLMKNGLDLMGGPDIDFKTTVADFKKAIKDCYNQAEAAGKSSIYGFGWLYQSFLDEGMPSREDLDEICPDIALFVSDSEGHKGLANTLCLVNAGIMKADGTVLKKAGFLTRDPRMKERKKYGLKAARRAPQFSKR